MKKNKQRCPWLDISKSDYVQYHDEEWGVPIYDDKRLFEYMILESAQAGLSWYTILQKRSGYRQAFAHFDVRLVAAFDQGQIDRLMQDATVVRHKAKIESAINNASKFIDIQDEFGSFSQYIWRFVSDKPIINTITCLKDYPVTSVLSDNISQDLKRRGFKFFGSRICYAYLQACGLVNDHSMSCFRKSEILNRLYDQEQ